MTYDAHAIRRAFPLLSKNDVIWLDNAATTQKPQAVLEAMTAFYENENANVNRGIHLLAERATVAYDESRETIRSHINAKKRHEVIVTHGTTEAINLVARSYGELLHEGDVIALSLLEHHSNIVPWQQLARRRNCEVRWVDIDEHGQIDPSSLDDVLKDGKVKIVAITAVSNVLGTITPLKDIIAKAHAARAVILVDAAQLAPHSPIDVQDLRCDFLVFSGHKVYGPTGVGILYGKEELLEKMPPFLGGGDMIQSVTTNGFTPAELPRTFEAGTPPIAQMIGLKAAINWMNGIGREAITQHERALLNRLLQRLRTIKDITILGPDDASRIASCVSVAVPNAHPHDLTQTMSEKFQVMARAGHHCAQPLHARLGIPASTRFSVAAYTTEEDIDRACDALEQSLTVWQR